MSIFRLLQIISRLKCSNYATNQKKYNPSARRL